MVEKLIEEVEKKLETGDLKPTVGDYIRLVQLHKDLEDEDLKEIEVRWVDPEGSEPDSGR